jgi:hypothetical protein
MNLERRAFLLLVTLAAAGPAFGQQVAPVAGLANIGAQGAAPHPWPPQAGASMDTRKFTPEVAKIMQAAFERVCRSLGLGTPDHYAPRSRRSQNRAPRKCRRSRRRRVVARRVLKDFKLLE